MAWLKSLTHRLRRLQQLGAKDGMLLIEAWLTLIWIDLVIRNRPYKKWQHWFVLKSKLVSEDKSRSVRVPHLIQITEIAARNHFRPMNCLCRTLTQQRMLHRRQVSCNIHIGVRMAEGGLEAHAWLTMRDKVLNDSEDVGDRYTELKLDQWIKRSRFVD